MSYSYSFLNEPKGQFPQPLAFDRLHLVIEKAGRMEKKK